MIRFISISAVCFNESLYCHWWQREWMPYTNYYTVTEGACCSNNPPPPFTARRRDIYTVYLSTQLGHVYVHNNHKHTHRHTILSSFFPLLAPACFPFVRTQRKGILSVILYSFGPFFIGTAYGGLWPTTLHHPWV